MAFSQNVFHFPYSSVLYWNWLKWDWISSYVAESRYWIKSINKPKLTFTWTNFNRTGDGTDNKTVHFIDKQIAFLFGLSEIDKKNICSQTPYRPSCSVY